MPWFRAGLAAIALFTTALALFFPTLLGPWAARLVAPGLAFALARIAGLLVIAFALARASARGTPRWRAVALIVALPTAVVGGLMGAYAALAPVHLLIVAAIAAGVVAACWWGARAGGAAA